MYERCPNCQSPWNENEIEFQLCNKCGFEDKKGRIKQQIKGFLRLLRWAITIILAVFFGSLLLYYSKGLASKSLGPGASATEIRNFSYFIIIIGVVLLVVLFLIVRRLIRRKK